MLVDADLDEIITGKRGMLRGIDACLETQCLVSAVALIYSTIDALSALTRPIDVPDTTPKIIADSERMEGPHDLLNLWLLRALGGSSFLTSSLSLRASSSIHLFEPNSPFNKFGKLKSASRVGQRSPAPEGVTCTSAKSLGDAPASPCANSAGNMKVAPLRSSTTMHFVRRW